MKRRSPAGQMSDAYLTALFLTLSGGFQDAYAYCFRGQVFANAQTGNIVLLSAHLLHGSWGNALHYAIPLVAFVTGTCFAELIRGAFRYARRLHWRQTILLIEITLLFFVGFIPIDNIANAMISFVCAMQVQSFRKMRGNSYASTMCIGNLRSGMDSLCAWLVGGSTKAFGKALHYFAIIFLFALGAGLGSLALAPMGSRAIWLSCLLLFISFCLMFLKEDIEELEEFEHLEHEEALKK